MTARALILSAQPLRRPTTLLRSSLLFSSLLSILLSVAGHNSIAAEQPTATTAATAPVTAPTTTGSPLPKATKVPPAPGATTKAEIAPLEQTIETFITSEEIDTDKAVDFPTNI